MTIRADRYPQKLLPGILLLNMIVIALAAYFLYLSSEEYPRDWWTEFRTTSALVVLYSIISALLGWQIVRSCRIQEADLDARIITSNEVQLRAILDASSDVLLISDAHGTITMANRQVEPILGYSNDDLIGQKIEVLVPTHLGDHHTTLRDEFLAAPGARRMGAGREINALRKDGTECPMEISLNQIEIDQGLFVFSALRNITKYKQADRALRQSNQKLRKLSAHMESLVEDERKHIAREVHDELGQLLTALKMDISLLRLRFGENPALMEKIDDMRSLVEEAIRVMRNVASTLRPIALDIGLRPALEWLTKDFSHRSGIRCHLGWDGDAATLDNEIVTAVFRIVQECLTNVARHAAASEVDITLAFDGHLQVTIEDNGRGFDTEKMDKVTGLGLLGMQERVLALNGTLDIQSDPEGGTRLTIELPLVQGEGQ